MTQRIDYLGIVKRAVVDTWRHKALWLFGFFLAAGGESGGGGNWNYSLASSGNVVSTSVSDQLSRLGSFDATRLAPLVVVLALMALVAALVLAVLRLMSEAALVGMGREIARGRAPGVAEGFRIGGRYWLKVLAVDFILALPILLILLLAVLAMVLFAASMGLLGSSGGLESLGAAGAGGICGIVALVGVLVIVLIPVAIVLAVIGELARRHVVLLDRGVFESLGAGWDMLRSKFKEVALMWLTLVAVGIVIGLVMAVLAMSLIAPGILLAIVSPPAGVLVLIPGVLVLVFLSGIVQSFSSLAWTDFFLAAEPSAA